LKQINFKIQADRAALITI